MQAQRRQQAATTPPRRAADHGDAVELAVGAAVDQHEIGLERLGVEAVVAEQRLAERRLRGGEAERQGRRRASITNCAEREHSTHTPSNTISALSSGKSGHQPGRRDSCRAAASASRRETGWRARPCGSGPAADLPAMAQEVIGQHDRHHGLAHRHGADADAGVVPALGGDLGLVAEAGRWCAGA